MGKNPIVAPRKVLQESSERAFVGNVVDGVAQEHLPNCFARLKNFCREIDGQGEKVHAFGSWF